MRFSILRAPSSSFRDHAARAQRPLLPAEPADARYSVCSAGEVEKFVLQRKAKRSRALRPRSRRSQRRGTKAARALERLIAWSRRSRGKIRTTGSALAREHQLRVRSHRWRPGVVSLVAKPARPRPMGRSSRSSSRRCASRREIVSVDSGRGPSGQVRAWRPADRGAAHQPRRGYGTSPA